MANSCFTIGPDISVLNPTTIANCVLWLDASDASTITKDSGNRISLWTDKSGNGQSRGQASAIRQPLYVTISPVSNMPGVKFDTDPQYLGDTSSTINPRGDITIFTVFRIVNHTNWGALYSMAQTAADGQGSPALGFNNTTNTGLISYNTAVSPTGAITLSTGSGILGTNNVAMYRRTGGTNGNGGTVNLETRGGAPATASGTQSWTSFDGDNYYIGRQGSTASVYKTLDGYICEHLCYERALTSDEQTQVWAYLQTKWSI